MAARFWTVVLALEVTLGLAVAGGIARWRALSPSAIALIVVVFAAALTTAVIGVTFAIAGSLAHPAPRARGGSLWPRALASELRDFCGAWIAMMLEPLLPDEDAALPLSSGAEPRPVLLLHGLGCNRAVWGPLRRRLRAAGYGPVWAINLTPPCAELQTHVITATRQLRRLVERAGGRPADVVAHSMGGLVARAMLSEPGLRPVGRLITLGTPHYGTTLARWLPCAGARAMRPDSTWLRSLNAAQAGHLPVPLISLYSPQDNIVMPAYRAVLRGAEAREVRGVGHFGLLRSRSALDAIEAALACTGTRRCESL